MWMWMRVWNALQARDESFGRSWRPRLVTVCDNRMRKPLARAARSVQDEQNHRFRRRSPRCHRRFLESRAFDLDRLAGDNLVTITSSTRALRGLTLGLVAAAALAACGGGDDDNAPKLQTLNAATPIVIAHRGASGYYPEETLEAYTLAIAMGADV